jgi:hypothetical protein
MNHMERIFMEKPVDPAFKQLHMYVSIMQELTRYAESENTLTVFELCKRALGEYVSNFPIAKDVCQMYIAVSTPHTMPQQLMKNSYTDEYIADINGILEEIFLHEEVTGAFKTLTSITN